MSTLERKKFEVFSMTLDPFGRFSKFSYAAMLSVVAGRCQNAR